MTRAHGAGGVGGARDIDADARCSSAPEMLELSTRKAVP